MSTNVETMFYVREKPWHGLGTRINENLFLREEASRARAFAGQFMELVDVAGMGLDMSEAS